MRNFQDTFESRKQSFINAFSIRMTVPLKIEFSLFFEKHVYFKGTTFTFLNKHPQLKCQKLIRTRAGVYRRMCM